MFAEIAAGGMAAIHLGRLRGPAGSSRTSSVRPCPVCDSSHSYLFCQRESPAPPEDADDILGAQVM